MHACSGVPRQGFTFHAGVAGYHRDTSPIIIFDPINQEIRGKSVLRKNTWLVIGVTDCRRGREGWGVGRGEEGELTETPKIRTGPIQ